MILREILPLSEQTFARLWFAVIQKEGQGRTGEFRDRYVWQQDGSWYMLVCSGSTSSDGGTALLYKTDELEVTAPVRSDKTSST